MSKRTKPNAIHSHDFSAEMAVIGYVLTTPDDITSEVQAITPDVFFDPINRKAWSIIQAVQHPNMITVVDASGGEIELATMQHCVDAAATHSDAWRRHVEIVKRHATTRRMAKAMLAMGDALKSGRSHDEVLADIKRMVEEAEAEAEATSSASSWMTEAVDAASLMGMDFKPTTFVVDGLLPTGLTLFAGKRKKGKSWLMLNVAVSVASNAARALGAYDTDQGRVLYLALEDTRKRIKDRLSMLMHGQTPPDRLHVITATEKWPRIGEGCIERLHGWMKANPDTRLIIIDLLAKVRNPRKMKDPYEDDYSNMVALHEVAHAHDVAVVVLHHVRKMESADDFDSISGTGGLTGAADTLWLLKSTDTDQAELKITGRDIEEQEIAIRSDFKHGLWTAIGDAAEERLSEARRQIIELLRSEGRPMSAAAVAKAIGKNEYTIRNLLAKMDGKEVEHGKRGYFV